MQIVAQGWLIYRLSHSARLLALDQFLAAFRSFCSRSSAASSPTGSSAQDSAGLAVFAVGDAATLTILVVTGLVHVWQILCLSAVSGFAQAFGGPAYQASIPNLVDREDMPNAIALNSIQFNLAVTIGPALAGQVLAKYGEAWCFGLNTISFVAPIIALSLITTRFLPQKTTDSMLRSLKEGIAFVRRQEAMEALIVLAFLMTFLSMPLRTYIPVFVKDIFHRGPETYGNLLSLMGVGSILGSLFIASLGNIKHKGRVALTMLAGLGTAIAVFSISKKLPLSMIMIAAVGFSMMGVFATVSSLCS